MDAKLTPAQTRAMDKLKAEGTVYAYNGVSASTIAALEAKGLVTVAWSVHTWWNRRSGRNHSMRDWSAQPK